MGEVHGHPGGRQGADCRLPQAVHAPLPRRHVLLLHPRSHLRPAPPAALHRLVTLGRGARLPAGGGSGGGRSGSLWQQQRLRVSAGQCSGTRQPPYRAARSRNVRGDMRAAAGTRSGHLLGAGWYTKLRGKWLSEQRHTNSRNERCHTAPGKPASRFKDERSAVACIKGSVVQGNLFKTESDSSWCM